MNRTRSTLLVIDGIINLLLGILLLLFPLGMDTVLGVPHVNTAFYPSILGAVLFGIGIALLLECFNKSKNISGLGVEGAIAINLAGAITLVIWLLVHPFDIPLRGFIILWSIVVLVLGIGGVEIIMGKSKRDKKNGEHMY